MSADDAPIVRATGLHARDAEGERGKSRGRVVDVELTLGPGMFAILGAPEEGTLALTGALAGRCPPLRGGLTVLGQSPSRSAGARARIGVLPYTPRLPAGAKVRQALELALRARGQEPSGIDAVLDPLGLASLHARRTASLSYAEARAIELALALTTPALGLLVLHEPGCDLALVNAAHLYERLQALARRDVCVLVTTSSPADAQAFGDRVARLTRGALAWPTEAAPAELVLSVHAGLRALAAALDRDPAIEAIAWRQAEIGPSILRVGGAELGACALAISSAITASGAVVEGVTHAPAGPIIGARGP